MVGDHALPSQGWVGKSAQMRGKAKRGGREEGGREGRLDDSLIAKVRAERRRQ